MHFLRQKKRVFKDNADKNCFLLVLVNKLFTLVQSFKVTNKMLGDAIRTKQQQNKKTKRDD